MNKALRVLIVEDSEDDALLLALELRRGGYQPTYQRVETATTFNAALTTQAWDLIIADYNMPQFSGQTALHIVQERDLDIPFIIVSGYLEEATAVEIMRRGARDYLMKNNLRRLVPTVARELRDAEVRRERRKAEQTLRASQERIRRASDALFQLARLPSLHEGNLDQALAGITEIASRTLQLDRVSIWLLSDDKRHFVCQELFELASAEHRAGLTYDLDSRPRYAAALQLNQSIVANEVAHDERLQEFYAEYYAPAGISATLEAIVRFHGRVVGVFAMERMSDAPLWTPEEELFATSVADLVAIALGADERRRSQEALRLSEERYRDLFENANDAIYTLDLEGRYTSINRRCEELTGYTRAEALGHHVSEVIAPEYHVYAYEPLRRKLAGELETTVYEMEIICKDGRRLPLEISTRLTYSGGQPVGIQGIARDISERRHLEDQLRHSQKMEAIGRLAGAVAHDFNNLLTAISGYSQLLKRRLNQQSPQVQRDVGEIIKASERAAALTQQLLAFSRRRVANFQAIELNQVVQELAPMLHRLISEDVQLTVAVAPTPQIIRADQNLIEQVIVNLAVNSRDAMPNGGQLLIATQECTVSANQANRHPDAQLGDYAVLIVQDTGVGMDRATQLRIFEPFFTTKAVGRGTGLGLSTVYGIVQQCDGFIEVESEVGRGATFRVHFPHTTALPVAPPPFLSVHHRVNGTETILLAEDDQAVCELVKHTLESYGYRVLVGENGQAALAQCQRYPGSIAALITDLVMPEMSGAELVRRIRTDRPEIKVLYMSGYADRSLLAEIESQGAAPILEKPFTPDLLAHRLRMLLDSAA